MKTKAPIYLLEFGMKFRFKSSYFTFLGCNQFGMYEATDKFGLIVEFKPLTSVYI